MIHVLILEDQEESRVALKKMIEEYHKKIEVTAVGDAREAEALLEQPGVSYDIFLLDINLNPGDEEDTAGFSFAEKIREYKKYEFTPIVMITSVSNMEMKSYRTLHCYQFIVKPYLREEIEELMGKVLSHQQEAETETIMVKKDGINYKINCQNIVYIRAIPRGICICMKREMLNVPYVSIRQLLGKLPDHKFMQVHRMYVINTDYMDYVDITNQIIKMRGYDEPVEIGGTYKERVRGLMKA